ncbi:RNA polymerase I enhancer binding protein [Arthrobotrys megalospora]
MLQSFWSYVAPTPKKSSQSQPIPEQEPEGSPTPIIDQSEQQPDMRNSSQRLSTPNYDGANGELVSSPNTKRKKHKKPKEVPVSIVEVPATAEQPEDNIEVEEDGTMADVSNAELSGKRKRRKSDLELSEKKAKRPRKQRKGVEDGEQVVVNGFTPINGDQDEPELEEDEEHPRIKGVRWFGDTPAIFYEGDWVEADLSHLKLPEKRKKTKRVPSPEIEHELEPELEEPEIEVVVGETDQGDEEAEASQKKQRKQKKESNKRHKPSPKPDDEEPELNLHAGEADEDDEETTKKQKKGKGKSRRQSEPEPQVKSATKGRKPRKSSGDAPEESSRRRTYPRTTDDPNLPQVIIPTPTDGSHNNSKGVGPPPRPPVYDKGPYTPAEDALIHRVVERYCQIQIPPLNRPGFVKLLWGNERHKTDFWNILMTNLPLRPRHSLHSHVKRMFHEFDERGKWTEEQDDELRDLVAQKGTKWSVIGNIIHRMPEDCRDRWKNYVVCGEKRRKSYWDDDETEKLVGILDDVLAILVADHEEKGTLVLEAAEGESEEERAARLEKEKGYHREEIDWPIVSERMGYTRSRMQCLWRAKGLWEKADTSPEYGSVKKGRTGSKNDNQKEKKPRSAKKGKKKRAEEEEEGEEGEEPTSPTLAEGKKMCPGDYLYVMQRISVQGYDCLASVDWNKIAQIDTVKHFTPEQFKAGFHNYMRDNNPEKKDLRSFVAERLEELSDMPAIYRNKRYRPPVGATSPAITKVPLTTGEKRTTRQQKKQAKEQVKQPGFSVEIETASGDADSQRSSPPLRLGSAERPVHSPGNPFAKQPKKGKKATPPSGNTPKKSPKKPYQSAEFISDSGDDIQDDNQESEEEDIIEDEDLTEVNGNYGSEADDEMGESVAFGNATKDRRR